MNVFKNAKKGFSNIMNKTGDYSKIAKLIVEIKKSENEIEKNQTEIGKYVIQKIKDGEITLDINVSNIKKFAEKIKEIELTITNYRKKIDELKQLHASKNQEIGEGES